MYGLEPTNGVAYSAYMPILQSAFAVSGSNPTTTIASTTTRATTTTTRATTATTTSRVTSTGTTSLPSPTGACAARYGQCGVSRHPQPNNMNDQDLTSYRATDGQARHAVRADRLAPKRTTGTRNACRCDDLADGQLVRFFNFSCKQTVSSLARGAAEGKSEDDMFVSCRR